MKPARTPPGDLPMPGCAASRFSSVERTEPARCGSSDRACPAEGANLTVQSTQDLGGGHATALAHLVAKPDQLVKGHAAHLIDQFAVDLLHEKPRPRVNRWILHRSRLVRFILQLPKRHRAIGTENVVQDVL